MKLKKIALVSIVMISSFAISGAFGDSNYKPLTPAQLDNLRKTTEDIVQSDVRRKNTPTEKLGIIAKRQDDLNIITKNLQTIKNGQVASENNLPEIAKKIKVDNQTTLAEYFEKLNKTDPDANKARDTENMMTKFQAITKTLDKEIKSITTQIQKSQSDKNR